MNNPKLPRNVRISTHDGSYIPQLLGKKSFANEVMTMTNRSNHMPTFTSNDAANMMASCAR